MTYEQFRALYSLILFLVAVLALGIAVISWRRRQAPGAIPLSAMAVGQAFWSLCYGLQLSSAVRPDPLFWFKLMFIGVVIVPASFFLFSLAYTGKGRFITSRLILLLTIEPILINLAIWTDPYHGLFSGRTASSVPIGGIAFWLHSAYSYSLLIAAGVLLFLYWRSCPPAYRMQAFIVLMGLPIATSANVITIFRLTPWPTIDFSPIGTLISSATLSYALFRYKMFDLIPFAREVVLEKMEDGVMVCDRDGRIVDMNESAERILGLQRNKTLGKGFEGVLDAWESIGDKIKGEKHILKAPLGSSYLDMRISPLVDARGRNQGYVAVMRDITELKKTEEKLREMNEVLNSRLEEIQMLQERLKEEAIRDPLTNLYNRRFLEETLKRELARVERSTGRLSLVMIDLDRFKDVNDMFGHQFGDQVLKALGDLISSQTRLGDVACRYGGEEFVVILPDAPIDSAVDRVEEWRKMFSDIEFRPEDRIIRVTFSAGVASYPEHGVTGNELISAADDAMYAAKLAGRNRVMVAKKVTI
ncbi:MAG: diguanylate cyclase [Syntrophales bacterium]|nr:diguanylate cyclase [Syntrophales bacterium]